MKNFVSSGILMKSVPLLAITLLFLLLSIPGSLVQEQNQTKPSKVEVRQESSNKTDSGEVSGENSVKVNVNNSTNTNQSNQNQTDTNSGGTCTVTKNGVTEVVPADSVKIDEHSQGNLDIHVKCENNQTSSSTQTSVKNNVNIQTNTSP